MSMSKALFEQITGFPQARLEPGLPAVTEYEAEGVRALGTYVGRSMSFEFSGIVPELYRAIHSAGSGRAFGPETNYLVKLVTAVYNLENKTVTIDVGLSRRADVTVVYDLENNTATIVGLPRLADVTMQPLEDDDEILKRLEKTLNTPLTLVDDEKIPEGSFHVAVGLDGKLIDGSKNTWTVDQLRAFLGDDFQVAAGMIKAFDPSHTQYGSPTRYKEDAGIVTCLATQANREKLLAWTKYTRQDHYTAETVIEPIKA